jgi:2-iminobutanoate/2-iminopropanoate deaminase
VANEIIRPETTAKTTGYSPAVRAGNTLYISGQVAQNRDGKLVGKDDIAAQAAQVFANLQAVIEAAGGTMHDIVKLNTFTTSLEFRPAIAEARGKYWQADWPASTFVVISSLATPDFLVEVEAVAVLQR